ncbi:MAG: hypothetical protein J6U71_02020 [Bacteroidales bacterium]|nr:hypothetical protein [Bacteroidales bacterium]
MQKAQYSNQIDKLATISQAVERYKIGRTKLVQIAEQAGAIRRFGRMVRIDIPKMDAEIEKY